MKTRKYYAGLMAAFFMALIMLTASQPAEALNLGSLTKDVGPQLAQVVADKLGIKIPADKIMGILDQGKSVSGMVSDPSKLLDLGMSKVNKGDMFNLLNKGNDKLSVTPEKGGDGITQNISQLFGPLSSMFK